MKRKPVIFGLLFLVLASAGAIVGERYFCAKPPINKEAFDKLKLAKTRQDVEAILGKPNEVEKEVLQSHGIDGFFFTWTGTEGRIIVWCDESGNVRFAAFRALGSEDVVWHDSSR